MGKTKNLDLNELVPFLCSEGVPEMMDLRDDRVCSSIMPGMNRQLMKKMVNYFLTTEDIRGDERTEWKGSRWTYTKDDHFDSFDYLVTSGCPNCGHDYDFGSSYHKLQMSPPSLRCFQCGHNAAPLHFENESDVLVDRFNATHKPKDDSEAWDGIYLMGSRAKYDFGQTNKEWWQNYFLPKVYRERDVKNSLDMIAMMQSFKAPTVDELCALCGNDKAFYHTFQARSADEGSTIMYECTVCHDRKVFNN